MIRLLCKLHEKDSDRIGSFEVYYLFSSWQWAIRNTRRTSLKIKHGYPKYFTNIFHWEILFCSPTVRPSKFGRKIQTCKIPVNKLFPKIIENIKWDFFLCLFFFSIDIHNKGCQKTNKQTSKTKHKVTKSKPRLPKPFVNLLT